MFTTSTHTEQISTYKTVDGFTRIYDKYSRSTAIKYPNDQKDPSKTMNYGAILSCCSISRQITKDDNGFLSVTYMYDDIPFIKCLSDGSLEIIEDPEDSRKLSKLSFKIDKSISTTLVYSPNINPPIFLLLNPQGSYFNFHSGIQGNINTARQNEVCVDILFNDKSSGILYSDNRLEWGYNGDSVIFCPTGEIQTIRNGELVREIFPHRFDPNYINETKKDYDEDNNKNPQTFILNSQDNSIMNPRIQKE